MEYFTRTLWNQLNSESASERAEAERQWARNEARYQKNIAQMKRRLSPDIRSFLQSSAAFHDAPVSEIAFRQEETGKTCRIALCLPDGTATIVLKDVRSCLVSLPSFQSAVAGQLCWGYGELQYVERKIYRLSVIFDLDNELEIEFGRMEFSSDGEI